MNYAYNDCDDIQRQTKRSGFGLDDYRSARPIQGTLLAADMITWKKRELWGPGVNFTELADG